MKQTYRTKLKQLWFPPAFRLQEPDFTQEQLDVLEELIGLIQPTLSRREAAFRDEKVQMAHFLIDLGTGIWRIRRKVGGMKRMPKELKEAMFSLESTWNSMAEGGVEIIDHIGTIPPAKEARVVDVREVAGLESEQVIDAILPTITLHGEVVQMGEVIMGRPAALPELHEELSRPQAGEGEAAAPGESEVESVG